MGQPPLLDSLRDGLGLFILLAAPEYELRSEHDAEQRQRQNLQRLNQKRDRDRIVGGDAELFGHQSVDELKEANISGRRPNDQADIDTQKTGETSGERDRDMGRGGRELECPELTRPCAERQ